MKNKNFSGFTLIELLVVIAIIAVLVGLVTPAVMNAQKQHVDALGMVMLSNIDQAISLYESDYGKYPPDDSSFSSKSLAEALINPSNKAEYYTLKDEKTELNEAGEFITPKNGYPFFFRVNKTRKDKANLNPPDAFNTKTYDLWARGCFDKDESPENCTINNWGGILFSAEEDGDE